MTRDYAAASAYAEFMERFQNNILATSMMYVSIYEHSDSKYIFSPDEINLTAEEIVKEDSSFIQHFFKVNKQESGTFQEKVAFFKKTQKLGPILLNNDNCYPCLPFYSVVKNKVEYVPHFTSGAFYGSNGMCAGNSPEEALCEGFFEVFERIVLCKIFTDRPVFPSIPLEYLKQFPRIFDMYEKLTSNPDYSVEVKDCSFNGKYPVVGLLVCNKWAGTYGFKLGSHYDYEIALERLFTEALQGTAVNTFATRTVFDFFEKATDNSKNIINAFKTGEASYPLSILEKNASSQFYRPDFIDSNATNKEILTKIIESFQKNHYDIYIRDVSTLGFPSYQIIIPSLSEVQNLTQSHYQMQLSSYYVKEMIANPETINKNNVTHIISLIYYSSGSLMEDTVSQFSGVKTRYNYPGKDVGLDNIYLLSMCYVFLEDYNKAYEAMKSFHANMKNYHTDNMVWYICVLRYLEGMIKFSDHNAVCNYVNKVFDKDICDKLDKVFKNPAEVLIKQYPKIELTYDELMNDESYKDFYLYRNALFELRRIQEKSMINQYNCRDIVCADKKVFEEEKSFI